MCFAGLAAVPGAALRQLGQLHTLNRGRSRAWAVSPIRVGSGCRLGRGWCDGGNGVHAGRIPARPPQGHLVRIIEYTVTVRDSDGGTRTEPFRLVTTLLDHELAPAGQLAAIYQERWEIENSYSELKTRLRGASFLLRSRSPELVRQELFASSPSTRPCAPCGPKRPAPPASTGTGSPSPSPSASRVTMPPARPTSPRSP